MDPVKMDDLIARLDDFNKNTAFTNDSDNNSRDSDPNRRRLVAAAYRLLARIETPFEQMWKFPTQLNVLAAVQSLITLELWRGWHDAGRPEATLNELTRVCQQPIETGLLRRLLRTVAAAHIVDEVDVDRYRATATSWALGGEKQPIAETAMVAGPCYAASALHLPTFLAATAYREPLDGTHTNFMDAHPLGMGLFAFLGSDAASQAAFVGSMRGLALRKPNWTAIVDMEALLQGGKAGDEAVAEPERVLFVDIGGGHGVDTMRMVQYQNGDFKSKERRGHLVLQDLPDVLSKAVVADDAVEQMPHDFFQPQPVQGARIYFLRSVLHDWNDEDACKILRNTATAMAPDGRSRLLVCDLVLPPTGATLDQASADMMMMHLHSARERTQGQWTALLESAGLRVVKVWGGEGSTDCILEAVLK